MSDYPQNSAQRLYESLPEIYRAKDQAANSDLKHYLGALGDVLDLTRHTLEQRYADSFPNAGPGEDQCQDWLIPYFAELLAVNLQSPYPNGQRAEVSNAVRWAQRKGTLGTTEEIIEAITQGEGEIQEGWKRVARTARIDIAALNALSPGAAKTANVTPDTRLHSRAVETEFGHTHARTWSGDKRYKIWPADDNDPFILPPSPTARIYWRQTHPHGAPCFPESYQDVSVRTPDFRSPGNIAGEVIGGFHPKRLIVYLPDAPGICSEDFTEFHRNEIRALIKLVLEARNDPENEKTLPEIIEDMGLNKLEALVDDAVPTFRNFVTVTASDNATLIFRNATAHSIVIKGHLSLEDDIHVRFEKLRFKNYVIQDAGSVSFYRCAIERFKTSLAGRLERIDAIFTDCLVNFLMAESITIQCEYVTVIKKIEAKRLLASDCIFPPLKNPANIVLGIEPCIRFSRIDGDMGEKNQNTNVQASIEDVDFCTPGCGVLLADTPDEIKFGAENGGEMGVYNAWQYSAQDQALARKLRDYLPVGIEPVIVRDATLNCKPPQPKTTS